MEPNDKKRREKRPRRPEGKPGGRKSPPAAGRDKSRPYRKERFSEKRGNEAPKKSFEKKPGWKKPRPGQARREKDDRPRREKRFSGEPGKKDGKKFFGERPGWKKTRAGEARRGPEDRPKREERRHSPHKKDFRPGRAEGPGPEARRGKPFKKEFRPGRDDSKDRRSGRPDRSYRDDRGKEARRDERRKPVSHALPA
jgi:ribonuclease E